MSVPLPMNSPLWIAMGWTMLHLLWVGGAIGVLAGIGGRQLRSARPEVRYLFALTCLGGLAVSPVAIFIWQVGASLRADRPSPILSGARNVEIRQQLLDRPMESFQIVSLPAPKDLPARARSLLAKIVAVLPCVWLGGTPLTFALLATGLIGAERLRRQCRVLDHGEIDVICRRLADSLSVGRHVAVGICDRLASPILLGIARPLILLPPSALTNWSIQQVEMVLLHELAHVRRCDNLVNLFQRIVESLLFFHPAVWWLSSRIRLERELCCDRMVVAHTGHGRAYAETLAALSGIRRTGRGVTVAMAENHLVIRIRRILNLEERPMDLKLSSSIVATVVAALLVPSLLIATYAQQTETKTKSIPKADTKAGGETTPQPRPKSDFSRASLLQVLEDAVRDADALKDARSRSRMFSAVATVRAKAGDQDAAQAAFRQAIQAADAIEDRSNRVYTLEDIAVAQIDGNDRAAALTTMRHASDVMETITDMFQRNSARSWIVRTFARAGDLDAAFRMVRDLPLENPSFLRARALANILEGLKPSGKPAMRQALPALLEAAAALPDQTTQSQCLSGLAEALADTGDLEGTSKIADILKKDAAEFGPQDHTRQNILHSQVFVLAALAKGQARSGNREAAVETFQKAVELAREMPAEGEALRSDRLGRLAHDRVEAGDIEGALQTTELVVYEYHKARALMEIAEAQAKAGRRDEARSLFRKAIETARAIQVRDPIRDRGRSFYLDSSECLRTIAYVQARAGFVEEAVQLAETIVEPRRKDSAFSRIAIEMARDADVKSAVRLADKIEDKNLRAQALQGIAEGQAETGDLRGALEWAEGRTTPEERANALLGVMQAIVKRPAATD
jgi:beta-lactamase regulating signal transducer with metallopeptidase domain/tetratricopeptide (TPR) repeat protein